MARGDLKIDKKERSCEICCNLSSSRVDTIECKLHKAKGGGYEEKELGVEPKAPLMVQHGVLKPLLIFSREIVRYNAHKAVVLDGIVA